MSHKKLEGKVVPIGGKVYKVGKFHEISQAGSKIPSFNVYKRGNRVFETYSAKIKPVKRK